MVKLPILVEIVAQDPSIPDIDAAAEVPVEEAAFSLFGLPLWASILIIAAAALLIVLAVWLIVRAVKPP